MSETRRMHFIPRTYLKHFAEARGDEFFIHALTKETGKMFNPNINNICLETDLYLLEGATTEERQRIETMYRELFEDDYDTVYKILTDDTKEKITMEERYDIISFIVSMFYRNNYWNNFFNHIMNEMLAKAYHLTKSNGKESFFFEEQEVSIAGKTLDQLQTENRNRDRQMVAITGMEAIFKLTRLRVLNDVVNVIRTEEEILTSDNPVIIQTRNIHERVIPLDPTNTLSLPIDAHHVVQLQPWGHELDRTMLGRTSRTSIMSVFYVEANNQFQHRQPGRFLLGSETAIKEFKIDSDGELLKKKMLNKFAGSAK